MSVGGINFSGLSSGLDSNSIIDATLTAERAPEQFWKNSITQLTQKQTAYNLVSAQLLNLQATATNIDGLRSFDIVTATSSSSDVASVTAQTGAQTGSHDITVNNLAKAQKLASSVQSSQTAPLGFTGQIIINGKAINVNANDSLQTLAGNINAAQPGVNASIISPSSNQYYLTLGSNNSGLQGQISLSDTAGGSFLGSTLGFLGSGTTLRHAISATVAGSDLFADSATSVATLEGQTAIPPAQGNVSITSGGVTKSVLVDLSKSLSGIASDINAAFGSTVATVASVTDPISGNSRQQLQLSGVTGAGDLTDDQNVLANLGLVQQNSAASSQLQAARDASFTIDGLSATRSTNTFSDVISGVTITLLKDSTGNSGTAPSTTLNVSSDTDTLKANIGAFVKAFNDTVDAISNQSQYDPASGKSGALFGDSTTSGIIDALTSSTTSQIPGLPGSVSALSQIGITLDQGNHLNIDDGQLSSALSGNLQGVAKLFRSAGTPTDPTVQFVSSTGDTKPSGPTGYAVNITQPAQQAVITAGTALTGALGQDEVLTFSGPIFGTTTGYPLTLTQGSSLADIVSKINGDAKLGSLLSASIVNNQLTLASKLYGSTAEFSVVSSIPTSTGNTSGIGDTILDQKGVDVAGTINGETATGIGQFLTGSQTGSGPASKGKAFGLQIRVTATTPGSYGSIAFTSGAADIVKNYINTQTDGFTGALTTAVTGFQDSIKDLQSSIDDLEARITDHQTSLRQQYADLETTIAQIKSSSSSLATLGALTTSSSSSK